jgi:hypothetical protein
MERSSWSCLTFSFYANQLILGLNHIGVVKCLYEAKLLPRIISGASSGSIMAALVCTRTEDEIPQLFDPLSVKLVCLAVFT